MRLTSLQSVSVVAFRQGHMKLCQRGTARSFTHALEQLDDGTGDYDKVIIEVLHEDEGEPEGLGL